MFVARHRTDRTDRTLCLGLLRAGSLYSPGTWRNPRTVHPVFFPYTGAHHHRLAAQWAVGKSRTCASGRVLLISAALSLGDPRGCQALAIAALMNERALQRENLLIKQIVRLMNQAKDSVRDNRRILMVQPGGVRPKNTHLACPIRPIRPIGLIPFAGIRHPPQFPHQSRLPCVLVPTL